MSIAGKSGLLAVAALCIASPQALAVTPVLSAGFDRTCAVDEPGRAYCWGNDATGSLGIGSRIESTSPVAVTGLSGGVSAVATSASSYHTCAIDQARELLCWGNNSNGQLGDGSIGEGTVPARVRLGAGVTSIATGNAHTCAVQAGALYCWGNNGFGQLGTGIPRHELTPARLTLAARTVTAGVNHACAATDAGAVHCWGDNRSGQVGTGSSEVAIPIPTPVPGLASGVTALASGYRHSCALTADGRVLCWGENLQGQLGDGTTTERRVPVAIAQAGVTFSEIAAGAFHTCGVTTTRRLFCWGGNGSLQLGRAGGISPTPAEVAGLPADIVSIALGWQHTCALTSANTLCWGNNALSQLGRVTAGNASAAAPVAGLARPLVAITAGTDHTCGLDAVGAITCWGGNTAFQLGDGQAVGIPRPVAVRGLPQTVTSVASGAFHVCALDPAGAVWCWGSGDQGQLGDGSLHNSATPVATRITSGAVSIASGTAHTCALAASAGVLCWGLNEFGQLGRGNNVDSAVPAAPNGLASGVVAVAAGHAHSCAVMSTGRVMCWGMNAAGQLGDGSNNDRAVPVAVAGITGGAQALALGSDHSCALLAGGAVSCWGAGTAGQLGDGTTGVRLVPWDPLESTCRHASLSIL